MEVEFLVENVLEDTRHRWPGPRHGWLSCVRCVDFFWLLALAFVP